MFPPPIMSMPLESAARRPRHLPRWFVALAATILAGGCREEGLSLGQPEPATTKASSSLLLDPCFDLPERQAVLDRMVEAINAERAAHNVAPVRVNATLSQVADFYACRLVDGEFFAHDDPYDGSSVDSRAADFGYPFVKVGENLAAGQRSVDDAVAAWMASPSHRAILLDPAYVDVGVSVKLGSRLGPIWVQEFGRPISAGDVPSAVASSRSAVAGDGREGLPTSGPSASPPHAHQAAAKTGK